jgi:outer membrane lipoprotein-sorting protein
MIMLALSAIACGCEGGGHSVKTTKNVPVALRPVAKEASQEELLNRYNLFARNLQTVDATVELKPTAGSKYSGVIEDYHEVKAFVLAARPNEIRMIGQVPVVGTTAFDMASDGHVFEVSIPSKNKFLEGPIAFERSSSKPIENLRPQHLVEALLWPEIRKEEAVVFEENSDDAARYYVLTVLRGGYKTEILRRIWFDRADLNVVRLQSYGPKGALVSDVRYSDWQLVATAGTGTSAIDTYPRIIRVDRPRDDYHLDLSVTKIALNEALNAERFRLEPPTGAEIVKLGETAEDKKP